MKVNALTSKYIIFMTDKDLDIKKIIDHWKVSSDQDYRTMLNLFKSTDYNWALFLGHLVIENVGSTIDIFDLQMQMLRLRRKVDLRIEPHPIKEEDFTSMNPFVNEIVLSGIELL